MFIRTNEHQYEIFTFFSYQVGEQGPGRGRNRHPSWLHAAVGGAEGRGQPPCPQPPRSRPAYHEQVLSFRQNQLRYSTSMGRDLRPSPLLSGILILLLASALVCGCLLSGESSPSPASQDPSLTLSEEAPADVTATPVETMTVTVSSPPTGTTASGPGTDLFTRRTFTFLSGRETYTLSVAVPPAPSVSANGTGDHCPMEHWRAGNEWQVSAYYLGRITSGPEQEMYTSLLAELSRIRRTEGLNEDEYLELITNFIQQIPYDPDAPLCPRTPTRVIRDGRGDCDEKSMLLLGLLAREGYDVAILLFPEQHHATAGIRITSVTSPSFRTFGPAGKLYVYVETTRPTLVGMYGDVFEKASVVAAPVGNGTTRYRAINDVMYVVGVQKRMEERMTFLLETRETDLQEILHLESRLTEGSYDSREEYDADIARYSWLVATYNQMGKDFTAIQAVHRFLLDHQYDRAGCRARIENGKVDEYL